MAKPEIKEPKVGDPIPKDSPWAVAYCDHEMKIVSYITVGRISEKKNLSAALTTKGEIHRIKRLGFDPIGLTIKDGEIQIGYKDRFRKRKLEVQKSLRFKSRARKLVENSLSLAKAVSWNLAAMISASAIASGLIFLFTPSDIVQISGLNDYLYIFIPLFATSIAIISLFTSINESRKLASEERHHSVRPLIFLKFIEDSQKQLRFDSDRPNLISLNEAGNPISGTFQIENHGLGLITNLRFYIHTGQSKESLSDSIELVKPEQKLSANTYFSSIWENGLITLYSVGEDVYGGKIITLHGLVQESIPTGTQVKVAFNHQLEPSSHYYKNLIAEIY